MKQDKAAAPLRQHEERERPQAAILRREAEEHARRHDPTFEEDLGGGIHLHDETKRVASRSRKGLKR